MNPFKYVHRKFSTILKTLVFLTMVLGCSAIASHYFLSDEPAGSGAPPAGPGLPTPKAKTEVRGVPISVVAASPAAYPAKVTVYGQAQALWQTTIKSQVNGRVDWISPAFRKGRLIQQGGALVRINDSQYRANLAQADQAVSSTGLDLLREEQEARQARINWKASGLSGQPGSPLVLRGPQIELAKKSVATARANREAASLDLSYCRIFAPFDGVVTDRLVSPGDTVSTGDPIAVIAGTDTMEVSLSLDPTQLNLLGRSLTETRVFLRDEAAGVAYAAGNLRDSRTIDPETRLRKIFCSVDNPLSLDPPLLPGTFLTVDISGKPKPNLLRLPVSALTRQGRVWTVTPENTLAAFSASALFYEGDHVFVEAPADRSFPLNIAVAPNAAFVTGMKVRPSSDTRALTASTTPAQGE
ncbi:MAG: efflux RND transporter periplasmic adaptor subunit [Desulfobacterales bacterium]|nr:efflux RND transporter periplasmic adaptor subunit [Desulfobacterales bacterium]